MAMYRAKRMMVALCGTFAHWNEGGNKSVVPGSIGAIFECHLLLQSASIVTSSSRLDLTAPVTTSTHTSHP